MCSRYWSRVCLGMVEPVGRVVGDRARVCLGMAEPGGRVVGYWARVCLGGLAEVRVCLGLAELGGACSRVPGALVLGYGGPCGVCSQVSGARVCLGMVEPWVCATEGRGYFRTFQGCRAIAGATARRQRAENERCKPWPLSCYSCSHDALAFARPRVVRLGPRWRDACAQCSKADTVARRSAATRGGEGGWKNKFSLKQQQHLLQSSRAQSRPLALGAAQTADRQTDRSEKRTA